MDDADENGMPTVEARLAKLEVEQGTDTAIIAALIATHPNLTQLRTQWAVMQQASSAEIRTAFADHPYLLQMVHMRMAYWLGVVQSAGTHPKRGGTDWVDGCVPKRFRDSASGPMDRSKKPADNGTAQR